MPLRTEKVEEILLEYHHLMCRLESSHMRASIVIYSKLDLKQIVDVSRWFWKRLSTILKRLERLTLLKSSKVSHMVGATAISKISSDKQAKSFQTQKSL